MGWEEKRGWVKKFEHFLQDHRQTEAYYRVVHEKVEQDIRPLCRHRTGDGARLPDRPLDLNEIGKASQPNDYVGVVYADGNNMGALLETLHSPEAYHHFAETVFGETQDAVFGALATAFTRAHVEQDRAAAHQGTWVHPFEDPQHWWRRPFPHGPGTPGPAYRHTDCPDSRKSTETGYAIQGRYSYDPEQVHRCPVDTASGLGKAPQSTVGLSVGVLLADAKTPIFFLQNLVEQLLKSAKRRAKELKKQHRYFGGTIDFMALKSVTMITSRLKEFRDSSLRVGCGSSHGTSLHSDRAAAVPGNGTDTQNDGIPPITTLRLTARSVGGAMGVDR